MAERAEREAFVTLATNDTYALGCLVLGVSLRQQAKTQRKLVVMVTEGVSASMRNQLARIFDMIYDVNLLDSRDAANLQLLGRPDLSVTFTKLHCWRLTMFEKAIFLDADTLVLQNVDELFDREELSAAPDAGWPDCFNSGVFVFRPSEETYKSLLDYAMSQGSFDGGDQGLLNMYFRDWATKDIARHLPFIYNVVSQAFYSYLPAFTQFKDSVKIVHFIGATKPWHHPYNTATGKVKPLPETGHNESYLQMWWDLFMKFIQPTLDPTLKKNVTDTINSHHQHLLNQSSSADDGIHPPKYTFPAMIPYMPPSLDDVYYTPSPSNQSDNSNHDDQQHQHDSSQPQSEVKEIPVITRIYSSLESHYSEEPLTNVNPDNPPVVIYDAPTVVQTWATASENLSQDSNKTENEKPVNVDSEVEKYNKVNTGHNTNNENDNVSEKQCTQVHSSSCENLPKKVEEYEKSGLVGELAALSIQSGGAYALDQSQLSDSERKLNWEKGQMDYLGADKFENIQKRLDQSLQGPPEEAPSTTSSPFTPAKPVTTSTTSTKRSTATFMPKK